MELKTMSLIDYVQLLKHLSRLMQEHKVTLETSVLEAIKDGFLQEC